MIRIVKAGDREAGLPEHTDRARHVNRRGDQEPALAGLGIEQRLGEARILDGVARSLFEGDARARDAQQNGNQDGKGKEFPTTHK